MDSIDFFGDMSSISQYIFDTWQLLWTAITGNLLLTLSFAITVLGFVFAVLRKIKHIRK